MLVLCCAYVQIAQTAGNCGPVSIVVSPLVSLVHDQVTALQNNGVAACALKVRMYSYTVSITYLHRMNCNDF
jgi:superfamily II DNA helicase RecQ